jgi:hypothetical protein
MASYKAFRALYCRTHLVYLLGLEASVDTVYTKSTLFINFLLYILLVFSTSPDLREGWVAKLVVRRVATASSLGSNPDIPQKS